MQLTRQEARELLEVEVRTSDAAHVGLRGLLGAFVQCGRIPATSRCQHGSEGAPHAGPAVFPPPPLPPAPPPLPWL